MTRLAGALLSRDLGPSTQAFVLKCRSPNPAHLFFEYFCQRDCVVGRSRDLPALSVVGMSGVFSEYLATCRAFALTFLFIQYTSLEL